jgi:hypothetical protein
MTTTSKSNKEIIAEAIEVMKGYDASFCDIKKSAFERSNIAVEFFTTPCMKQVISLLEVLNK